MHKSMKLKVFVVLLLAVACLAVICKALATPKEEAAIRTIVTDSIPVVVDERPDFMSKSPQEGLMGALVYYEVDHPEIVYAQAILETGNFKSYGCLTRNNLFGLRKKDGDYMSFGHWTLSVAAYKRYIQKYSHPPNDYYQYLQDLGYAEDPEYITKLKQIVK